MIRRLALVAVLIGAVALTVGVVAIARDGATPRPVAAPTADLGTVPAAGTSGPAAPVARPTTLRAGSRLELPRLGVDAPISDVGLDGRVMQVPRDPHVIGWWRDGAAPGSGRGTVVLVGHVNYAGTAGALGVLPRARPGDRVSVGERRYRVAAVRTYPKTTGIPDTAFATGGRERLVLITCGGSFDPGTGNYVDNVVAYAVPAA